MDLARLVGQESLQAFKGFLQGEAEDLAEWGKIIAADAVRAVKEGKEDILSELKEQAPAVAELKRIKAQGFSWDQVASVVLALAKVAVQAVNLKG